MIERVEAIKLNQRDLVLLYEAGQAGPAHHAVPLHKVVQELWCGALQLFRLPNGIILTEVVCGFDGTKRLNIVAMAGNNVAQHFQAISNDLQHAARELGCNAIECDVYSEKLARALRRGGAKQESVTMVLELNDG